MRQQPQCTWGAPPSQSATYNYGGGMRRVQSANASRPRGAVGTTAGRNKPLSTVHKSRSHSQETVRRNANAVYEVAPPPPASEQLPIPQCKNTLLEIARTKSDQTDLRRMYDYATWNMYDRIVSARNRKRMSLEADNSDDLDTTLNQEEGKKESSSAPSKNTDKPSSSATTTATTSCNSSFTSSPSNQAAIACKGSGIIKTSGNNKTTATIKKVQASTASNTASSASATTKTTTTSTQAMSSSSIYKQQAAATNTNATQTSLHHKLHSIKKTFSSQDTDSSQGGTAATESTSLESEDSYGGNRSGCNSPATFPGCMVRSTSHRTMSQGSEDDHFIFQLDM